MASLFVVMAVSVLSVAYLQLSLSKNREGRSSVDAKRAFYLAEAGLSESFTAIRMGRSGNVGTEEEPAQFASGVFWVTAVEQDDNTTLLTSVGLCGSGRSCLSVVVDKSESSVQSLGVFGDENVTVGEGALIDSYDSRLGDYESQGYDPEWYETGGASGADEGASGGSDGEGGGAAPRGSWLPVDGVHAPRTALREAVWVGSASTAAVLPAQATLPVAQTTEDAAQGNFNLREWAGAVQGLSDVERLPRSSKISGNGDITIMGAPEGADPTRVLGQVTPGPDGTVTTESGALVTGSTTPADERTLLPPVEVPALDPQGDLTLARGAVLTGVEWSYGTLQAPAGSALVLKGPLKLVVEDFVVEAGAQLQIDTSAGPVELYATEYFGLEEGAQVVSATQEPAEAVFIVTASEWVDRDGDGVDDSPAVLDAAGEMHAVVYAPDAALTIDSELEFFGSLAAREITIGPDAQVHFDLALEEVASGPLIIPKLASWRIVDLPRAPIVQQKLDPLLWLKAQGLTPQKSDLAYKDRVLDIRFVCHGGHTHDYVGPKHLFKWRVVQTTLAQTTLDAPAGRMPPPDSDYMDPVYGHAAELNSNPFVPDP